MPGKSIRERLYWSLKLHGLRGTSVSIFFSLAAKAGASWGKSDWYHQFVDKCFDRKAGVETSSVVEIKDLSVPDEMRPKLVEYYPSPALDFCMALNRLELDKYSFVDLGCGKGKAIILASLFPFSSVTGVELCPTLSQTASENVSKNKLVNHSSKPVSVINADATTCLLPQTDLLIYLFNPFNADLLKTAITNIEQCLTANPRKTYLLYSNPVHRQQLDQSKIWKECTERITGFNDWCALYEHKKE